MEKTAISIPKIPTSGNDFENISWNPPEVYLAEQEYAARHQHHKRFSWWSTTPEEMSDLGPGITLYFYLVRTLVIAFTGMSLFALTNIIINTSGDGFESDAGFEKTTLGNFGPVREIEMECEGRGAEEVCVQHSHWNKTMTIMGSQVDKEPMILTEIYMDLIAVVIFAGAIIWMNRQQPRIMVDVDTKSITLEDYSVQVTNLPADCVQEDLFEHIQSRFGQVVSVYLVRNNGALLKLALQRGALATQIQTHAAHKAAAVDTGDTSGEKEHTEKLDELTKEVLEVSGKMREEIKEADTSDVVMAFATFRKEESFVNCVNHPRPNLWKRISGSAPDKFKNKVLKFSKAPSPTNIMWENLAISKSEKILRTAFTGGFKFLMLLISFGLISVAQSMQESLQRVEDDVCEAHNCGYSGDPPIIQDPVARAQYYFCATGTPWTEEDLTGGVEPTTCLLPRDVDCFDCFCFAAVEAGTIVDEKEYCQEYFQAYTVQAGVGMLASLVVVAINMCLKYTLAWLATIEKHHTVSDEQSSMMSKLFMAQFINTGLLTVIANAAWTEASRELEGTDLHGKVLDGQYQDLDSVWYEDVALSIVVTMVLSPVAKRGMVIYLYFQHKWTKARATTKAVTQAELTAAYMGPQFTLAEKYGEMLTAVFVTLLFSAGIPILIPLAALNFTSQYIVDKIELFRISQEPPKYDAALSIQATSTLKWAVLNHLLLGVWALTYITTRKDDFVNSLLGDQVRALVDMWASLPRPLDSLFGVLDTDNAANRLLQKTGAPITFVLVLALWVLIINRVLTLVPTQVKVAVNRMRGKVEVEEAEGNPPLDVALRTNQLQGLRSYNIQENPKYANAFVMPDWDQVDNYAAEEAPNADGKEEYYDYDDGDAVQALDRAEWGDDH